MSRPTRVAWWRLPFTAETWRRTAAALVAGPVSIAGLPLALLGGYRTVSRMQRGIARRWLRLRVDEPAGGDRAVRVVVHALLSLPAGIVSLVLAAVLWGNTARNLTYPLWDAAAADWGGPSLAGRWAVHAAGGVAFLFLTPWAVLAVTWVQGILTRRLLGSSR